jgi:hypothetical protein
MPLKCVMLQIINNYIPLYGFYGFGPIIRGQNFLVTNAMFTYKQYPKHTLRNKV